MEQIEYIGTFKQGNGDGYEHFTVKTSTGWFEYAALDTNKPINILGAVYFKQWVLYSTTDFYTVKSLDTPVANLINNAILTRIENNFNKTYKIPVANATTDGKTLIIGAKNEDGDNILLRTTDMINFNISTFSNKIDSDIDQIYYTGDKWLVLADYLLYSSDDAKLFTPVSNVNNSAYAVAGIDCFAYAKDPDTTTNNSIYVVSGCNKNVVSDQPPGYGCGVCTIFNNDTGTPEKCMETKVNQTVGGYPSYIVTNGKISLGVLDYYYPIQPCRDCLVQNIVGTDSWLLVDSMKNIRICSNILYNSDKKEWLLCGVEGAVPYSYTSTDGTTWTKGDKFMNEVKYFSYKKNISITCDPPCQNGQTCDNTTGKCIGGGDPPSDSSGGVPWMWIALGISVLVLGLVIYVNVMNKMKKKGNIGSHRVVNIHLE